MTPLSTIRSVLLASCAVILVACGGGGGSDSAGSSPQASTTTTPVAAPAVSAPAPAPLLNTTSPSTPAATTPTTTPAQTETAVLGAAEFTASAGLAQKGPLIKGSGVTVQELSKSLVPNGKQYSFQISSDLGTFEPNAKFTSQYVSVAAAGYYFDESSGVVSSAPITLYGLSDVSADSSLNVNLLTMLAFQRIQVLITRSGLSFSAARAQAEGEVLTALGIRKGSIGSAFGTLDIAAGTDGARALAAVSSVFVTGNTAGNLSQLMANFQSDLADDGKISDASTLATLAASARAINPAQVADNLNRRYAATNAYFMPADISNWIDQEGDGLIGQFKFQVNDASASSTFTLPTSVTEPYAGTGLSATSGRLVVNGVAASGSVLLKKGDVISVQPTAGALPDGPLTIYVMSGSSRIARVTFVKGLTAIALYPGNSTVTAGASVQFNAVGTFTDGTSVDLTSRANWTSSVASVATIGASTGLATGLGSGATIITATVGAISARTTLSSTVVSLVSIAVAPSSLSLDVNAFQQLRATGTFSNGTTADVTTSLIWSSDQASVARVTNGLVSGVAAGSAVVRASSTSGSVTSPAVPVSVQSIVVKAPVANAGQPQSAFPNDLVTLNAQGSFDTNIPTRPLTYSWFIVTKPNGSTASLSNAATSTPSFRADIVGAYVFGLVVNNGVVSSVLSTVGVTVSPLIVPTAFAGRNQAVQIGSSVMLDGSGSVDSNLPAMTLSYVWALTSRPTGSSASLSNVTSIFPTMVIDVPGAYTASLTVCRATLCSAPSTVQIRGGQASAYRSVAPGVHTLATRYDGTLWAWGLSNEKGQMGDGSLVTRYSPTYIGSGYREVAVSLYHSLAIKTDGTLWAWGSNSAGQLGDGTRSDSMVPRQVASGFIEISAGWDHSVGLKTDGTLWAWGSNTYGQLGDGTNNPSLYPKQIGSGYRQISATAYRTMALKTDGSIWAWGKDVGDATNVGSFVPRQITNGFSAIQAGLGYNVALKPDGTLWAWGNNANGELGDGTTAARYAPKQIGSGFREFAVGQFSGGINIGLKQDGSLWTWGHNGNGGLGNGSYLPASVPAQIASGYIAIAGAWGNGGHAVKSDGVMWGWGFIPFGTVNNTAYTTYVPIPSP
jgi:alpha-tubulin suppressor-like RCC1 family protein